MPVKLVVILDYVYKAIPVNKHVGEEQIEYLDFNKVPVRYFSDNLSLLSGTYAYMYEKISKPL